MLIGVIVAIMVAIVVGISLIPVIVGTVEEIESSAEAGITPMPIDIVSFSVPSPTWALFVLGIAMLAVGVAWCWD